jgi:UDP-N-acetylglucosamine--N-acetylmuramyl-(pentapeptide) pyrophosphoryl-undecaprenol N-acetylglucosamine transferase
VTIPKLKVLICAGGSGGHLFPARQLRELLKEDCLVFFAGHKLRGSPFFESKEIPFQEISSSQKKKGVLAICKGFFQSIFLLYSFSPDVVVGFGSYHTFPLLLAASFLRKKIILFEANSTLGKVNRWFSFFSKKIAFQFEQTHKKGALVPLLPWIATSNRQMSQAQARIHFGLDPFKTTLLVFGGSQGAFFLNQMIPLAIEKLQGEFQVIHLTGKGFEKVTYQTKSYVREFEKQMDLAYTASSCAICRSGAGTIAELTRYQMPALLIPFPLASEDHQRKNGEFFIAHTKGARLLLQSDATLDRLVEEIEALIGEADTFRKSLQSYSLQTQKRVDFASLIRQIGDS